MRLRSPYCRLALLFALTLGNSLTQAQEKGAPGSGKTPSVAAAAQPSPLPARAVADKLAPAGWSRYEIGQPTRFSLILPGEPSGGMERMNLTPKVAVTVRTYMSVGETGLYGATYIDDLPAAELNEAAKRTFFESFVKGFAEGFQQGMRQGATPVAPLKMLEHRATTASGLAGYEQDFSFDKMMGRIRLVFDGGRAYAVLGLWTGLATSSERTAFFDSLRVNRRR